MMMRLWHVCARIQILATGLLVFTHFGGAIAASAAGNPSALTYQARLLNSTGTGALLDSNVTLKFSIYNPAGTCLLFEEEHTSIDTNATQGLVSLQIGAGTPTSAHPGLSMAVIFANSGTEIRAAASANCAPGYTPASGDSRRLRVTVTPNAGAPMTLSPDKYFQSVPYAWSAESVQGLTPSNLIQSTGNTSQATVGTLTNQDGGAADDASSLHHHDSRYALSGSSTTQSFGSGGISTTGTVSAASIGIGVSAPSGSLEIAPAANTTAIRSSGYSLTGSNTTPLLDLSGTWNTSGVANGFRFNISDTASHGNSTIFDVQRNGGSVFKIGKWGDLWSTSGMIGGGAYRAGRFNVRDSSTSWGHVMGIVQDDDTLKALLILNESHSTTANNGLQLWQTNSGVGRINAGSAADPAGISITTNGDVGVKTTAPAATLDVAGETKVGNTGLACSAATQGSIRYNTIGNVLEFCNGTAWTPVQTPTTCTDATPNTFSFSNLSNQTTSTLVSSNIVQVTGIDCAVTSSVSGTGSPQHRVCSDAACATVLQDWTSGQSAATVGQYVQIRLSTPAASGATHEASLIVGGTAAIWSSSTAVADCTVGTPPVGSVCGDGTVYAGLSPDGNTKMYATRCDLGQNWDGSSCSGTRQTPTWNNGTSSWTLSNSASTTSGAANTSTVAALADAASPHHAASLCDSLTVHGHSDWYLPAKDELAVLYDGKDAIGNFVSNRYWSSTDGGLQPDRALFHGFNDGLQAFLQKNSPYTVRCVRR